MTVGWNLVLIFLVGVGKPPQPHDFAIRNVTIVDVRESRLRPDMTVLIRGDRIAKVAAGLELPKDIRVIDGRGKFLIPGLWDMHVHLAALDPDPEAVEKLVAHGVNGVRDMGGRTGEIEQLRVSIRSQRRSGPRIVRAGPILNGNQPAEFHRVVATIKEGRYAVRELARDGMDFIKVHNAMNPDVFFAVAVEAKAVGLDVVGHVPHGVSLIEASDAGIKSIEHAEVLMETEMFQRDNPARGIPDALARLQGKGAQKLFQRFVSNGTSLTPTLSAYGAFVKSQSDSAARAMGNRLFDRLKYIVGAAHRAGVTILAGTDSADVGSNPGARLHQELALLVEAGLSPADALSAATLSAASFLGLEDEGEIAAGKKANAVLLDGNPLEDIRNVARTHSVVVRGCLLGPDDLHYAKTPFEASIP